MKRILHTFFIIVITIFGARGAEDELDAVVAVNIEISQYIELYSVTKTSISSNMIFFLDIQTW